MISTTMQRCSAIALAILLAGCAGAFAPNCEKFEQSRKETDYATHYSMSEPETAKRAREFKALGKAAAAAPLYRLALNTDEVSPCTHLKITKELYLQRNPGRGDALEETREFFAPSGKLIATRKEVVTDQLPKTGYYTATAPLPISEGMPAGKYRVTGRLVLKPRGNSRQAQVLARASAEFVVVPLKKK
jgi:hypothetical protein